MSGTSSSTPTSTTGTPARTTGSPGQEEYAKGWIDCFYAYHGLGPAEAHWPYEQFQRYDADVMMRHLFEEGHVDVAIFQPTYLTQWYTEGFNTTERNGILAELHPDRFVLNGAWDPRAGDAGLDEFDRQGRAIPPQGRQAVHGRVARGVTRMEPQERRGRALPRGV